MRSDLNEYKRKHVHRMVLEAFVGPCPPGMEACHNNGDRSDARLENLRWDSKKSNAADKIAHGTLACGTRHGMYGVKILGSSNHTAKLNEELVVTIRARYERGESQRRIARSLGVSQKAVWSVLRGLTWGHVELSCG